MAMKTKTTRTERYEVCSLCGGRGTEPAINNGMTTTVATTMTCRSCSGAGQRLVETTTTTETVEE